MSMASPVLNALALKGGVQVKIERAPWVTAGGDPGAAWADFGAVVGFELHPKQTSKVIECDNSLGDLAEYLSKEEFTLSFQVLEVGLKMRAEALGHTSASVDASAGVSETLPLGPPTVHREWQLRISEPNLALQSTAGGDTFAQRQHILWRCHQTADLPEKIGKGEHSAYKFTYRVLQDTSVTPSATQDQYGKIVDLVTP
jgi:hypothetical protein